MKVHVHRHEQDVRFIVIYLWISNPLKMGSRVFSSHGQSATNDAIFALGFIQAAQS